MISMSRWVSIATLALLTVASACLAAEPPSAGPSFLPAQEPAPVPASSDTGGVKLDETPATTPAPAVVAPAPAAAPKAADARGDHPGYGGVGGQLGAAKVVGNGDYSEDAVTRLSFSANWRYTMAPSWRWQLSPGFLWAAYSKKSNPAPFQDIHFPTDPYKDRYLTLIAPITTQLQWVHRGKQVWHVGAGPGLYRVWVENHRKVVLDPVTLKPHRGLYPGGTAEIGVERFSKNLTTTSIEITVDAHYIAAVRDEQFPSGFNDTILAMGMRIGVNYYFSLKAKPKKQEGILPG
jgi:hypothetical protein